MKGLGLGLGLGLMGARLGGVRGAGRVACASEAVLGCAAHRAPPVPFLALALALALAAACTLSCPHARAAPTMTKP